MMPSSPNKIYCNEQNCPKRNRTREYRAAESSSIDEMDQLMGNDKETEISDSLAKSASVNTLIPIKTAEKSAEAYFDRNHENLIFCLNQFRSSNSSETSPRESQMLCTMLKIQPPTATAEKMQSWHPSQPITGDLSKCAGNTNNIMPSSSSSSSSSLLTEYLRVKSFSWKQKQSQYKDQQLQRTPTQKVNISLDDLSRPQLRQTATPRAFFSNQDNNQDLKKSCTSSTDYTVLANKKKKFISSSEEQFFSCDSEESENDEKSENVFNRQHQYNTRADNHTILQLLHELKNLINNKGNAIRPKNLENAVTPSSPATYSSKTKTQETRSNLKHNDKASKRTSTNGLDYMIWSPQSCFCSCRAHIPPSNFTHFPPFNLTTGPLDNTQLPQTFVCAGNESLTHIPSGSKSIPTADQVADHVSPFILTTATLDGTQLPPTFKCEENYYFKPAFSGNSCIVTADRSADNFLPYNLSNPSLDDVQLPPTFVREVNYSFKQASSGSKSIVTADRSADNFPPFNLSNTALDDIELPQPFVSEENASFKPASSGHKSTTAYDQSADNFPPFNFSSPALDDIQPPLPFVSEDSFKPISSDNKSILTADHLDDNLVCTCSAANGSLENEMGPCPPQTVTSNFRMDAAVQTNGSLCLREEIGTQFYASSEEVDSFKDCSSGRNSVLASEQAPGHLICKCICKRLSLVDREESLTESCVLEAANKRNDRSSLSEAQPSLNSDSLKSAPKAVPCLWQVEEEVDEELQLCYVDKIFTEPFDIYKINTDSLSQYDDEEPSIKQYSDEVEMESNNRSEKKASRETFKFEQVCQLEAVDMPNLTQPAQSLKTTEMDELSDPGQQLAEFETEKQADSLKREEFPNQINLKSENESCEFTKLKEVETQLVKTSELAVLPDIEKQTIKLETEKDVSPSICKEFEEIVRSKNEAIEFTKLEEEKTPTQLVQTAELDVLSNAKEQAIELETEKDVDSLALKEFAELVKPETLSELNEPTEFINAEEEKIFPATANAEPDVLSYSREDLSVEAQYAHDKTQESDVSTPSLKVKKTSSFMVYNSVTTGHVSANFLPQLTPPRNTEQPITYEHSTAEDDDELAKEKLAENYKSKKPDENDRKHAKEMLLATGMQTETKTCSAEMFFVDSLMLDLEAMDYARRKTQFEKNIYPSKKLAPCIRDSFPVTITEVTGLTANSLYVKWKIHDCLGVGGYEIYADGFLTNRFYSSRHQAAVITRIDATVPHKIALVAQPEAGDESLDLICNMGSKSNKFKSLPWRTADKSQQQCSFTLWTPSIFLYDSVPHI